MACIHEQAESYSTSEIVCDSEEVFGFAPGVLVRDHTSPAPTEAGSCLRARFVGHASYVIGIESELENTGSISPCTAYAEQRASNDYNAMVSRILGLLQEEDEQEDDYGAVVPTKTALSRVLTILSEAFRDVKTIFPLAAVTVSFDGGIRIQWIRPDSSLRLVIPGGEGEEAYIYHEHEDEYGTEAASAPILARRIRWLQRIRTHAESTL